MEAIANSIYLTNFAILPRAIEKVSSLRYMFKCLGCNAQDDDTCPTKDLGDNFSCDTDCM